MTHLWFPNSKENTLSKGARPGQWTPQSARSLGDQASNLSYDGITSRINSLPTPWSRAIQFENAITDPSYPTRDQLLDELFGGLAVLALWSLYNLEVRAKTVRLKELKKDRDPAGRLFASSLKVNQPAPEHSILAAGRSQALLPGMCWTYLWSRVSQLVFPPRAPYFALLSNCGGPLTVWTGAKRVDSVTLRPILPLRSTANLLQTGLRNWLRASSALSQTTETWWRIWLRS